MSKAPNSTAPQPVIDQLEYIGSPLAYARKTMKRIPELEKLPGAFDDLIHSLTFLTAYNGSGATFNSYRREIERLLQWCWLIQKVTLTYLGRQDIEAYIHFCQDPPKAWTGDRQAARFTGPEGERKASTIWRPFVSKADKIGRMSSTALSQKSLQSVFAVLSTYFNFLLQEDYLKVNPVALIRQKSKFLQRHAYQEPVRRLSNMQWDFILETTEQLAKEHPAEHERTLFVMNCLFGMYLRISELVADERSAPVMGDFQKDQDGNWWLRVVGKGNKARMVTVSDDMLKTLRRYRTHLGLPPLPYVGEQTPLVAKLRGRGPVTSTRQIRYMVQACFDRALDRMKSDGLEEEARELRVATVHWLRHTGISEDVKFRPKEHVREDAGHASMATTDRYIDTEMRERHASARHKKIKPEL
ncbi:MAG: integrase [Oceanospirillales bacterium]|jgi:site-specific recombinase XerD|uniref:tyrosine-type recombinase/integrase n=1 Tax=Thalassolituus oleivorans TaxID=187493 RepID=UPI00094922B0|nr:site-specific integrase [Thalassolituus oleivorans]APR67198.1 integrase [Thalassolituus oleivorans]PCI48517.1 MAG: integrase [Oceanospirillales bacterium]